MVTLTALDCPKCGARMDVFVGEKATICLYCSAPVLIQWSSALEASVTCCRIDHHPGCIQEIANSLKAKVDFYRQEWARLENEYEPIWKEFAKQKRPILEQEHGSGGTPYYLSETQKKQLEPYLDGLKSKLIPRGNRSNHLALKIDLSLQNCRALKGGRSKHSWSGWPRIFSNILEVEPQGVSYLGLFEPLFYELSRWNMLAPELGKVDNFVPVQMLVRSMPVAFTRNLELGQAAEINHRLMIAGAIGRIAATDLTGHLLTAMKVPAWEEAEQAISH